MHTLTLHFKSTAMRDRFIIIAHGMGIHGKTGIRPGTFRYRVVAECPDSKTHTALTAAWGKVTAERK